MLFAALKALTMAMAAMALLMRVVAMPFCWCSKARRGKREIESNWMVTRMATVGRMTRVRS
jgi:hypothetical protein